MDNIKFIGKINEVKFEIKSMERKGIVNLSSLDINNSPSSFLLEHDGVHYGISKWVSPKRTRSEPFSRVYNTLGEAKRITIIPIQKDEGKDGDHDHINASTLAWMNLLGVYVILAFYDSAERNDNYKNKISKQKFNSEYINGMIKEVINYQSDAHHWNNNHFSSNFRDISSRSKEAYKKISKETSVEMHPFQNKEIQEFNMEDFIKTSSIRSSLAAKRESVTLHSLESLSQGTKKATIEISNFYDGKYNLTLDEVFFDKETNKMILQESKNTTIGKIPSPGEVNDALFKTLLFNNIDTLYLDGESEEEKIDFEIRIRLTSNKLKGKIILPTTEELIKKFSEDNNIKEEKILKLNEEATKRSSILQAYLKIVIEENE